MQEKYPTEGEDGNIAIFGTGSETGGGSGAKILIEKIINGEITDINKVTIFSNYISGGVSKILDTKDEESGKSYKEVLKEKNISSEFVYLDNYPEEDNNIETLIQSLQNEYGFKYIFLSGFLKKVIGLNPKFIINIHPGGNKEQGYGGKGMHGMKVHEKVWEDYNKGEINKSCVTIHFATEKFDDGPVIAQIPVNIFKCESAEDIQKSVNIVEHKIQHKVTELINNGAINWSGKKGDSLEIDYSKIKKEDFPEGTVFGEILDLIK